MSRNCFLFIYANEQDNEYERLMDLWTDAGYLQAYAHNNQVKDVYGFIDDILRNAEEIQDYLENLSRNEQPFGFYFQALQESEAKAKILSLQKGKIRRNRLRLYGIKLDDNCYVISGGAIKMSQKMEGHPDTANELLKLNTARQYLKGKGVLDEDSFYELIQEEP